MAHHLIIAYGNPDRQDDGVGWHTIQRLCVRLERPVPEDFSAGLEDLDSDPAMLFTLQLTPELAELISGYDSVCFVDAHTGAHPQDLHIETLNPEFQPSSFTHHMTAQTLLSIARHLYAKTPNGVLVSVRGYAFGFSHDLSPQTNRSVDNAVKWILDWIQNGDLS